MSRQTTNGSQSEDWASRVGTAPITVLEALATDTESVGPCRSNVSTRVQGDPDDQ
jgi:hypothetical protein